jgi:hypothetical protein
VTGFRWTSDNRRQVKLAYRAAAVAGLSDAAEVLLEEANRSVPIEESTLARSGTTSVDPAALKAAVAYDTVYAARQHEDLTLRHDPGRRAKWLELSMQENASRLGRTIQNRMREVTK